MKTVFLVLIIGGLAAAGFWYITENDRADKAEAYRRHQAEVAKRETEEKERLARQKEEDERLRKERTEAMAKEDAVRLFLNYIDREEERLKEEAEEAKIALEKIDVDQDSLSEELQAIERANAARVASAEKRNEKQRDKIERVGALLRSVTLNRLARTYCGEDLSALRGEFEAAVQYIKDVQDRFRERKDKNRRKYNEMVADADEKVNRKLKAAKEKYDFYAKNVDTSRIPNLKKQLADIELKIQKNLGKKSRTKWDERDLKELQARQVSLQNHLAQFEDIGGLAAANVAHMEATDAETEARRKFNRAAETLRDDDIAAQEERDHEQDVFTVASRFEDRSLDRIRQAMQNARQIRGAELAQCEKKLAFLKRSSVNVDFLNAQEVEEMRRKVAKTISAEIIEGVSE